jgi:hypothetical protein
MFSKFDLQELQSDWNFKGIGHNKDSYKKTHAIGSVYVTVICGLCYTKWQPWILTLTLHFIGKLCNTVFTCIRFMLFSLVLPWNRGAKILRGIIGRLCFIGGLFINFQWNVSGLWCRLDVLSKIADEPFCWTVVFLGMLKNVGVYQRFRSMTKCTILLATFLRRKVSK